MRSTRKKNKEDANNVTNALPSVDAFSDKIDPVLLNISVA